MAHAPLSPSAAHRWVHCPGSILAEAPYPDHENKFMLEGTQGHELLENCILQGKDASELAEDCHKPDMVEAVQYTLDIVRSWEALPGFREIRAESRVSCEELLDAPVWGTADIVGVFDDHIKIADFKGGQGHQVEAVNNEQLEIYVLAVMGREELYKNAGVPHFLHIPPLAAEGIIIQPRGTGSKMRTTFLDNPTMLELVEKYRAAAKAALSPKAERVAGEKQCKFCKAKADCPTLKQSMAISTEALPLEGDSMNLPADPATLTPEQQSNLLENLANIRKWLDNFESFAATALMGGAEIPGWKVVEGKNLTRWAVSDDEVARKLGRQGPKIKAQQLFTTTKKVKTPLQIKKLVAQESPEKAERTEKVIASLVVEKLGKPKVVRDSDPAPAHPGILSFDKVEQIKNG